MIKEIDEYLLSLANEWMKCMLHQHTDLDKRIVSTCNNELANAKARFKMLENEMV